MNEDNVIDRIVDILDYLGTNSLNAQYDEAREFGPIDGEGDKNVWYDHVCQAFMATMMGY